jgi:hypothetical protein
MAYHSNGSWAFWGITITFALVLLLGYLAYKLRVRVVKLNDDQD